MEGFLRVAEELDAVIVDIRYRAFSRAPMWRPAAMREAWGWRYVYMQSLGNVNYRGGLVEFANLEQGLRAVRSIILGSEPITPGVGGRSVILMCGCEDVNHCHRRLAAQAISERMGTDWHELTWEEIMGEARPANSQGRRGTGRGTGGSGGTLIQTDMFR